MIYRRLKRRGYEVYAVNPHYRIIDDDCCYENLVSLPKHPDVVYMVVSPAKGLPIVSEAAKLGIQYLWLQPGTFDHALLKQIQELGMKAIQACVLVATR